MSFCKDCISGVRHEGSPGGTYEEINGIKTYVATPSTDYPKDKALLYVADIFGYELPNNTLLADDFARNGFKVYFPDLFEGDPAPADALNPGSNFDLYKWLANHKPEHTVKRVRRVVEGLKEQGIAVYGATGYCYGARLVFDLAFDNVIQTAVVATPVPCPERRIGCTYLEKSKAALLINSCEFDDLFPPSLAKTADEKFSKFAPGYRRTYFEGVRHGFAVRGDPNSPVVNAAKEGAFKASVEWLLKYLK